MLYLTRWTKHGIHFYWKKNQHIAIISNQATCELKKTTWIRWIRPLPTLLRYLENKNKKQTKKTFARAGIRSQDRRFLPLPCRPTRHAGAHEHMDAKSTSHTRSLVEFHNEGKCYRRERETRLLAAFFSITFWFRDSPSSCFDPLWFFSSLTFSSVHLDFLVQWKDWKY